MKRRIFASLTAFTLIASFVATTFGSVGSHRSLKVKANPLVSLLPASDAVVTANAKRFFGDALPKVLASNQKLLGEILSKVDSIQTKTGVDLRKFDLVAAGINLIKKAGNDFDFDPVVIAQGTIDSASVIESVKRASGAKIREESLNGRTIVVISAADVLANIDPNAPAATAQKVQEFVNDLAVTAIDGNTVAVGSLTRIRETVAGKSTVSAELTELLGKKAPSLVNFAANVPGGMSTLLPLDNDDLGMNIDSIKTVYGNADITAGQATVSITGRTLQPQQAIDLKGTFEGLRDIGKSFLGGSKAADKQLYARLLTNLRISQAGNELTFDLAVPQSDIDLLVAVLHK